MNRTLIFALILMSVLSNKTYSQNFETLTSRIFFDTDLKNVDTSLISYFKSKPGVTLNKDTGWSAYPPSDSPTFFFTLSFSSHPYFPSGFKTGSIIVQINTGSEKVSGMSLSLSYKSKTTFDSTYQSIKELYRKYSSKSIARPNIAPPFEVTKYISKDTSNYVTITKGETSEAFYMNIAYNY